MNENIDLTKILKNCPRGTKFYTSVWGEVSFDKIIEKEIYNISIYTLSGYRSITKEGCYFNRDDVECIFFPSKEQRDWSKFTAPWFNNENLIQNKFDPKTLNPFDKVLVRDYRTVVDSPLSLWRCQIFSFIREEDEDYPYVGIGESYKFCIPYNDDTKHLVGTKDEAPEFYKYWED